MTKDHHCFVYVIAVEIDGQPTAPTKVGITGNVSIRLNGMQTGSPVKLMLVCAFEMESRDQAKAVERAFHDDQDKCRVRGEWFDVDPIDASQTLCSLVLESADKNLLPRESIARIVADVRDAQDMAHWLGKGSSWPVTNEKIRELLS